MSVTSWAQRLLAHGGLQVSRTKSAQTWLPSEATPEERKIIQRVQPYTMTSWQRIWGLLRAVRYIHDFDLPGDFVECGVWRGGSVMAMALQLLDLGEPRRQLWLYDTFEGMTPPTAEDVDAVTGASANSLLASTPVGDGSNVWCVAGLDDVRRNLSSTGYPEELLRYIQGDVTSTVTNNAPETISLLRLDTDWYASTRAELEVLYPRLVSGGVCILDDYGQWQGARKAVDEYFSDERVRPLIMPIDFSGRIFVKP